MGGEMRGMSDTPLTGLFNEEAPALAPDSKVAAVIVQQGKILDFIDGHTQREETPEEYVRQEIAKSLVREYDYAKRNIAVEFTVRMGSRKPRADLVVFYPGKPHKQEEAYLIVECKAQSVKSSDRKEGVGQLQSYMTACLNSRYGMWTNGLERFCYRVAGDEDGRSKRRQLTSS